MSSFNPDTESVNITIIGSFNPTIFHPSWLKQQNLISNSDFDYSQKNESVKVMHPQITNLMFSWCTIEVLQDKFRITTSQEAYFEQVFDLVNGIFSLLRHTPITSYGFNYTIKQNMESPKQVKKFLSKFFADKLLSQKKITPTEIQFRVEENVDLGYSATVNLRSDINPQTLFMNLNHHYNLEVSKDLTFIASFIPKTKDVIHLSKNMSKLIFNL